MAATHRCGKRQDQRAGLQPYPTSRRHCRRWQPTQDERDACVCVRQSVLDILPIGGKAILDARRFERQPILHALPLASDFRPHVSDELLELLLVRHRRKNYWLTARSCRCRSQRVYRLPKEAREAGDIPWEWIVDETRASAIHEGS